MGLLNSKKVEVEVLVDGEWQRYILQEDDTLEVSHKTFWLGSSVPVVRVKWVA